MAKRPLLLLAWSLVTLCAPTLRAEPYLVIVVNPESGVIQLSRDEVRNIFLGRQKSLLSGLAVTPIELQDPEVRSRFYQLLVNKDLAEINAYWARLLFTGQAHPPRKAPDAESVIRMVLADKGAVGLMRAGKEDRRVRVVLALGAQEKP